MELLSVPYEQKIIMRNLMELYQYDTSIYEEEHDNDVNEYGLFDYKYLDHYWTEEGRYPFFVVYSGKLAGFVLVREIKGEATFSVAEVFILRKYRGQGLGKQAATTVFKRFKGKWVVAWLENNLPAQAFWIKTIAEYSGDNFTETTSQGKPALQFYS
ncbi:GNAT family N-acetyltransferase [Paenibacillus sp. YAF4_2]|uniref:GNAT family N-acetyltransferase n=1 Tax=Paenibacillus sp. YAF4_2 TaxID=3233085 RepID=UPI003F944385